jgi:hypothetical protein
VEYSPDETPGLVEGAPMSAAFGTPAVRALAGFDHWVVWKRVWRGDEATKPPFTLDWRNASTTNPATWTSFEAARRAVPTTGHERGVGFVFASDDPFVGIDLDGCRNPQTGEIAEWAQVLIDSVDSYTEISPSQTGVKIVAEGSLPQAGRKTELADVERCSFKRPAIEMYASSRYFTVTGQHVQGTPETIEPRQAALDALFEKFFSGLRAQRGKPAAEAGSETSRSPGLTDEEVLEVALGARNGALTRALYESGDIRAYADDDSRADQALANRLAFYTGDDLDQLWRLIQTSALYRPKWDRQDYRDRTLQHAVDGLSGVYQRPRQHIVAERVEIAAEPIALLAAVPEFPTAVLPGPLRELVEAGYAVGVPRALMAGAGLAALAVAIGGHTSLEAMRGWVVRCIVWIVNIAARGAGKTPAQDYAFGWLRRHDEHVWPTYNEELVAYLADRKRGSRPHPRDPRVLAEDTNLEALARRLADTPSVGLDLDELSQLLRGLGEYKRGQSGDRGRLLKLWSGTPWAYQRVGSAGLSINAIQLLITRPTVVMCGGLQPELHELLGDDRDGLRPRWLPFLANLPTHEPSGDGVEVEQWDKLIETLVGLRTQERHWELGQVARARFRWWQRNWKTQARGDETASVSAALDKADNHVLRYTLALAEADAPGTGTTKGMVSPDTIDRAAAIIEFNIDSWRALPEPQGLAVSRKDEVLDELVERWRVWLEQHGGRATARALLANHVGGVRTQELRDQVLERYVATYPDTVEHGTSTGGRPPLIVTAPHRAQPRQYSTRTFAATAADFRSHSQEGSSDFRASETGVAAESAENESGLQARQAEVGNATSAVYEDFRSQQKSQKSTLAGESDFRASETGVAAESAENESGLQARQAEVAAETSRVAAKAPGSGCESPSDRALTGLGCRACGQPLRQVHEANLQLHDDCTLPWRPPA